MRSVWRNLEVGSIVRGIGYRAGGISSILWGVGGGTLLPSDLKNTDFEHRLSQELNYDMFSGVFTWKVNKRGPAKKGTVAGSLNKHGYRKITVAGTAHYAHRLAWFMFYEKWPSGELDHEDRNKDNNSIFNLREATRQQNSQNREASGAVLVENRWEARITHNGKLLYIGSYGTRDLAEAAYQTKAKELRKEFSAY